MQEKVTFELEEELVEVFYEIARKSQLTPDELFSLWAKRYIAEGFESACEGW